MVISKAPSSHSLCACAMGESGQTHTEECSLVAGAKEVDNLPVGPGNGGTRVTVSTSWGKRVREACSLQFRRRTIWRK